MVKAMFFLYRRPDLDREAFEHYGWVVHVPLVRKVPWLQRYVVNYTMTNLSGVDGACDGVAELWFASEESFRAALASPEGVAALADQANYLDMTRTHALMVVELPVPLPGDRVDLTTYA